MRLFAKFYHWLTHPYRIYRLKSFLFSCQIPFYTKKKIEGRFKQSFQKESSFSQKKERPIILFSSCENSFRTGDLKYNGGIKVYNLWIKLLRQRGYESYIVTFDGKYQPWLIEHQPCVSLQKIKEWKKQGKNLKFVTGWLDSKAFIDLASQFYFIDCEIAYTATIHFHFLKKFLQSKKIKKISTNSRIQQAWYMASFKFSPFLIQDWSDEDYWFPGLELRKPGLVGYMKESSFSEKEIEEIKNLCLKNNLKLNFLEIRGNEDEVISKMQQCDFYLGLNPGKHLLWGEGSPRSQQEAMHTGCVVIAYDVHGNREYLIDNYTGFLVSRKRPDVIAKHLINLMKNPKLKEKIRDKSVDFIAYNFTSINKFSLLRNFLELEKKQNS